MHSGDVIRQWPDKKRAEWEKKFYWIHTLKPRKVRPYS